MMMICGSHWGIEEVGVPAVVTRADDCLAILIFIIRKTKIRLSKGIKHSFKYEIEYFCMKKP